MERNKRVLNDLKCDKCRKDHKTVRDTTARKPSRSSQLTKRLKHLVYVFLWPMAEPLRPLRSSDWPMFSLNAAVQNTQYHQDMEYTTEYEEEHHNWAASEGHQQWHDHYTYHMYPIDYTSPFSPDSGFSD
ncbi:hypothetical protein Dda_7131 [Drechslerella dactyloides]|uniref:Uncharacterized protein n=1 Tax=Drechslerella dactyloides TaxID=74499 RepID=A0AAD6ITQ5_DREDA|nr:hypothetical protein Dda_7131 [Drechslerella dactyloides]